MSSLNSMGNNPAPLSNAEAPKLNNTEKYGSNNKIQELVKKMQSSPSGVKFLSDNDEQIMSLLENGDIAGVTELLSQFQDIPVVGRQKEEAPSITSLNKRDISAAETRTTATEERTTATEERTTATKEKKIKLESTQKAMDALNASVNKIHELFGWPEGFQKTFGDNYVQWKKGAEAKIGELPPNATEKEKKEHSSRIEAYIVLNNQEVILQKTPEDKKQELQALFWELRSSARTLEIPYPSSLSKEPVANSTCETITRELGISRTDSITRKGSLLIADKKDADGKDIRIAVDISKIPPERVVVGNSLRASAASEENILQKHEEKILDLQLQKDTQKNLFDSNKKIHEWRAINSVFPGLENLSRNANITDIESVITLGREFDAMADKKLTEEKKAGINDSDKAILEQAIKTIQDSIKSMVEASWRFYAIGRQISEEQRILERESSKPKDSKESRDSIARENIAFFESIGLSEFGQDDFQDFLKKFNGTNAGFEVDPKTITLKNKGWDPADGKYGRGVEEKDKKSIIENLIKKLPDNKKIGDFVKCDAEWVITPPLTLKSNPETGKTLLQETLRTFKSENKKAPWTQEAQK